VISFRQHVVSLIAVFLALAVGIVLGGGPMSAVGQGLVEEAAPEDSGSEPDPAVQARAEYGDELAGALAGAAYGDGLANVPVVLLAMPGSDRTAADDLAAEVEEAGGRVSGRYDVQESMVAVGEKALVDTLGSQLATQQGKGTVTAGASTYDRMGQLVARAVASTDESGARVDESATTIAESLRAGDLLVADGKPSGRGAYVVVLLGPDGDVEEDPIYAGLLSGLARQSVGVVAAASAEDGVAGRVSRLREDPVAEEIVTVDGVDHTSGVVTAVLALATWPESRGRQLGASGSDGAVPLG
jgi:hypothetical protein